MKSHRIHAAACSRGHSLLAFFASEDVLFFSLSGCQKMTLSHQAMALNKTVQEKFVIPGVRADLIIRSPQVVLAYLGELDRMSLKDSARNKVPRIGPDNEPLFHIVRHAKHSGNAEVSVLHQGNFYSIPNNSANRSMAAPNLFQQLIDLQDKKIDQNPSSIQVLGN